MVVVIGLGRMECSSHPLCESQGEAMSTLRLELRKQENTAGAAVNRPDGGV
jgi:hypothetical protein